MKQKFLVPLDGSVLGEHALPWVKLLATKLQIPVELMRCFESISSTHVLPDVVSPSSMGFDQEAVDQELEDYLLGQVQAFPGHLASAGRYEGDPATVILDRTETGEIKAVIMASHGRGGLGRWLLGSVATKVLRGSRVPVLVINASTDVADVPELNRILVPLDGSKVAEAALPHAAELAKAFEAELVLYQGVTHTPIGHPDLDKAVNLEAQNSRDYLEEVKSQYPDIKVSTEVRIAGLQLGIQAQAENCDLIVMSSHGRSGVKRWLLGSVAENILQSVHRPVMIVYGRED